MRVASIGSGSKGNGTIVEASEGRVLVDLGFGLKETARRLAKLNLTPLDIDALIVTHEHADHILGVAQFSRKFKVPVYMTLGTFDHKRLGALEAVYPVNYEQRFKIRGLTVEPVVVPHDAREPCQYVFSEGPCRLGVLTDLGHVSAHVAKCYKECDLLLLECNYDPGMLSRGPYPAALKQRVSGNLGHLSNDQAAGLLTQLNLTRLRHLVVSHISQKNNHPDLAKAALSDPLKNWSGTLTISSQNDGFDWIQV